MSKLLQMRQTALNVNYYSEQTTPGGAVHIMDIRSHRHRNRKEVEVSSRTLPGLAVLFLGVVIFIAGIVLFAMFGLPTDLAQYPHRLAAPLVLILGILVSIAGMVYAARLKRPHKRVPSQEQP